MYQTLFDRRKYNLNFFEILFIVYSLFQVCLLKWLWDKSFYQYVFDFYCIYFIIVGVLSKKIREYRLINIGFVLVLLNLIVIWLNVNENGATSNFLNNIGIVFGNLFIIIFIGFIIKNKREELEKLIVKYLSVILNIYFFINVPIIIIQIFSKGFMMRTTGATLMYVDQITGLIGANGTHRMTFYWLALTLINIYVYQKYKKKLMLFMIFSQIIFMLIISSYCDNTAFYYFFPLIILEFFVKELLKINIKRFLKFLSIAIVIIIFGIYLYNNNNQFNEFYNSRIMEKYEQFTGQNDKQGDEQRISLFKYALDYGNGYKLGSGIGNATYGDSKLPPQFGMSEISIITYQGGLIYLISIILLYSYYSYKLINPSNKSKLTRLIFYIMLIINYAIMAIYTQIFSTFEIIFILAIILSIFNFKYSRKDL